MRGSATLDEDNAERIKKYLDEVLRRQNEMKKAIPQVVQMLDTATWQLAAKKHLETISPDMAKEINYGLGVTFKTIKAALPMPPDYGVTFVRQSTTSSSAAASSLVYESLVSVRDPQHPDLKLDDLLMAYAALQEQQGRIDETKRRVHVLFPSLLDRFRLAAQAYRLAVVVDDAPEIQNAALAMRNLVDGLQGELLEKARTQPKENMTWDGMVQRLTKDATKSSLLLEQGQNRGSLIAVLSDIAKGRPTEYTVKEAWTRFLDHVYIVTGSLS
jgi:hypothetical protein